LIAVQAFRARVERSRPAGVRRRDIGAKLFLSVFP
jgi:hypothetical protein